MPFGRPGRTGALFRILFLRIHLSRNARRHGHRDRYGRMGDLLHAKHGVSSIPPDGILNHRNLQRLASISSEVKPALKCAKKRPLKSKGVLHTVSSFRAGFSLESAVRVGRFFFSCQHIVHRWRTRHGTGNRILGGGIVIFINFSYHPQRASG